MGKKYLTIRVLILLGVFAVSFFLFFCKNNFIHYEDGAPVIVAKQSNNQKIPSPTKEDKENEDVYTKNYNKTMRTIQALKDSLQDGDDFHQDGDRIIIKRKNGQTEKYEIVHGIAGDSLMRIS